MPPLTESKAVNVLYPNDDEDNGMVYFGWRGPSAVTEGYDIHGCYLLLKYLSENSVSPLQKAFVEIEDPYASNVEFTIIENSISMLAITIDGVPANKIYKVRGVLQEVFDKLATNFDQFDMSRMATVIQRHILETLSNFESCPHESVAYQIMGHFLYGNTKEDVRLMFFFLSFKKQFVAYVCNDNYLTTFYFFSWNDVSIKSKSCKNSLSSLKSIGRTCLPSI